MSFFCQGAYLVIAASNGGNLRQSSESVISFAGSIDTTVISNEATGPKVRLNNRAMKFAASYIQENTEALEQAKERGRLCFGMMDSVFTKYELPVELKYLAVIESELKPAALSHVGAAGPWQLMPATARLLGLKVTRKYDERKYFTKSTVAAAKYIKDLYGEFGDWLLVLAAYNGGPAPVYKAIQKSGSRNFWKLQAFLPAETRGHVKRFISTHYYFEGQGGVTTLTKTEMNNYIAKLNEFNASKSVNIPEVKTDDSSIDSNANHLIAEKIVKGQGIQKTNL